jgi:signal peptidase I
VRAGPGGSRRETRARVRGPRPAARHATHGDPPPAPSEPGFPTPLALAPPPVVVRETVPADPYARHHEDGSPGHASSEAPAPATSVHRLATPYRADARVRGGSHVHTVDGTGLHRTSRKRRDAAGGVLGALTEVVVVVGMALVLALVVKTFLVQAFFIPSESMERTLLVGDRVLVSKLTPGPFELERGDVVVFKDPGGWLTPLPEPQDGAFRAGLRTVLTFVGLLPQDSGEHLIKRVVGLPGDRVQCCDATGRLTVNGVPVDEPYLDDGIAPSTMPFDVTVPADRLWVMGDNRSSSEDSRFHTDLEGGGTVPVSSVVGAAFVVVWPVGRAGTLGTPEGAFASVPAPGGAP